MALVNRLLGESIKGAREFDQHAGSARRHWDNLATNMTVLTSRLGPVLGPLTQGLANELMKANTWLKSGVASTTQHFVNYADATREVSQVMREAGLSSQALRRNTAAMAKDLQAVAAAIGTIPIATGGGAATQIERMRTEIQGLQESIGQQQNIMTHVFSDASSESLKFSTRIASLRDQIESFQQTTAETGPVVDARFDKLRTVFDDLARTQTGYHAVVTKNLALFGQNVPNLEQFHKGILATAAALRSVGSDTSITDLQSGLSNLAALQAEYERAIGSTGVVLGSMTTKGDLVNKWMTESASAVESLNQRIKDLRAGIAHLSADTSVAPGTVNQLQSAVDNLARAQNRLSASSATMRVRFSQNSDILNLLFDQLKTAQEAILGRTAANVVNLSMATLHRIAAPLKSSVIAAIVAYVDNAFDSLNRHLDIFTSGLSWRFKTIRETLYVSAELGSSITAAMALVRELGRLGRLNQANWQGVLRTSILMTEALGLSASHAASIVVFTERLGTPLERMADTLTQIRETTRLTADEMGQYSTVLLKSIMLLGRLQDVASTVKETLRIDDALRSFTGESGQFVQAINRMISTSEGAMMAQTLGFGPGQLGRKGGQEIFAQRIGGLVDRLTRGQPFLAQITILEDLSHMTGLSVGSLKQLSTAMKELRGQTDSTKTIHQRWREEIVNFGDNLSKFGNIMKDVFMIGMQPIIYVINRVLYGVNALFESLGKLKPLLVTLSAVVTTSAIVSGISMVVAVKRFTSELIKSMVVFNLYAESLRRDTVVRGGLAAAENIGGAGKAGLRGLVGRLVTRLRFGNLFGRIIPRALTSLPSTIGSLTTTLSAPLLVIASGITAIVGMLAYFIREQAKVTREIRSTERLGTQGVVESLRKALIDQTARARDVRIDSDGTVRMLARRGSGRSGETWFDPKSMYQGPLSGLLKDGSISAATYARLVGEFDTRVARMAELAVNRQAINEIVKAGPSSPEILKRLDDLVAAVKEMVRKSEDLKQQGKTQFEIEQSLERERLDRLEWEGLMRKIDGPAFQH